MSVGILGVLLCAILSTSQNWEFNIFFFIKLSIFVLKWIGKCDILFLFNACQT